MSQKLWPAMLMVTLVVTPAAIARAQTNPWYIPPQPSYQPQPTIQGYATTPTGALPQSSSQLGLGAGYPGYYGAAAPAAPLQGSQPQWGAQQQGYGSVQLAPTGAGAAPAQPIYQQQPVYQQPQQVYQLPPQGNYPPLGSDPTELTTTKRSATPRATAQSASRSEAEPAAPRAPSALDYHPGFAGPSTLTPGYGGVGGYSPFYPAPPGAAPYLGMPFF